MNPTATTTLDREVEYLRAIDVAHIHRVHPSVVTRWFAKGVRLRDGSRLYPDAIKRPGGWWISRKALNEFLETLTRDARGQSEDARAEVPASVASDRAEQALEIGGW